MTGSWTSTGHHRAPSTWLESVEVEVDGELEGYALAQLHHDGRIGHCLTPIRASRSSAWADATEVAILSGRGLVYMGEAGPRPQLVRLDPDQPAPADLFKHLGEDSED